MARPDPYRHLTDPSTHGDPELAKLARQAVRLAEQHAAAQDRLTTARQHREQLPDQLADQGATAALAGKPGPNVREAIAEADAELAAAEVEADGLGRALDQARQAVEDYLAERGQRLRDECAARLAELRDAAHAAVADTAAAQVDAYSDALALQQALQPAKHRRIVGHPRALHDALATDRAGLTDTRQTVGPVKRLLSQAAAALAELPPHPEPAPDDDRPLELTADG